MRPIFPSVSVTIVREVKAGYSTLHDRYPSLATFLDIPRDEAEANWKWTCGSNAPSDREGFRIQTDYFEKDMRTARQKVNDAISEKFPEGTADEFYSESTDNAVIIDNYGKAWQIFPSGLAQRI